MSSIETTQIDIVKLSDHPLCNDQCRACHYKTLPYSEQLQRKQEWAVRQLGRWKTVLENIRSAPPHEQLAYRSKSWLRSTYVNGALTLGMFRSIFQDGRWKKEIISWNTCPLHSEAIQITIQKLRAVFEQLDPGFLEHSLMGVWIGTPHLVVVSKNRDFNLMSQLDWNKILEPPLDRVWFHQNPQVGKNVFGHHSIEYIAGPPEPEAHRVHPIRAFRQNAKSLLIEARAQAVQALLKRKSFLVVDLFCGTGDLSLHLPSDVGWIGIECSNEAIQFANGLRSRETVVHQGFAGKIESRLYDPRVLELISEPYSLYMNPPRSGLSEQALESILHLMKLKSPQSLVYLSCSASSLSRDLHEFEKQQYVVQGLQPFDFFPQTEHFETLAILERI